MLPGGVASRAHRASPRRTIAALLRRRLRLDPRPRPVPGSAFGQGGEQALTNWLDEHGSVGYIEVEVDALPGMHRVEDVEAILIQPLSTVEHQQVDEPDEAEVDGSIKVGS